MVLLFSHSRRFSISTSYMSHDGGTNIGLMGQRQTSSGDIGAKGDDIGIEQYRRRRVHTE